MSETKFGDADQERILTEIADQLKFLLPPGWEYLQLRYKAMGGYNETTAIVHSVTGQLSPWSPPSVIPELFDQLRVVAANPYSGTWLSAVFEMRHPGAYRADFNRTVEPDYQNPLPARTYAEELRRFPCAEENIPEWLRQYAAEVDGGTPGP